MYNGQWRMVNNQWRMNNGTWHKDISAFIVKWSTLFIIHLTLFIYSSCQPKQVTPVDGLIGKVWKAKSVKEGTTVVYTDGGTGNVKPGYSGFRLDLTKKDQVTLKDIDGRTLTGTWSVSTDNTRLILEKLQPNPTGTVGTIEYLFLSLPTATNMNMQRTAESRKTGNSINEYELVPE